MCWMYYHLNNRNAHNCTYTARPTGWFRWCPWRPSSRSKGGSGLRSRPATSSQHPMSITLGMILSATHPSWPVSWRTVSSTVAGAPHHDESKAKSYQQFFITWQKNLLTCNSFHTCYQWFIVFCNCALISEARGFEDVKIELNKVSHIKNKRFFIWVSGNVCQFIL